MVFDRDVPAISCRHSSRLPGRVRAAAIAVLAAALLAGCSARDCAYYGRPGYNVHCVVRGPSPIGGSN